MAARHGGGRIRDLRGRERRRIGCLGPLPAQPGAGGGVHQPRQSRIRGRAFQNLTAATRVIDRLTEAFRTCEGIGWHEQHEDMFEGTERFFRPGYLANLTSSWIPSLTGADKRLADGARVADVGCGFGASTIIMAQAYPNSTFEGVDYHQPSIEAARGRAAAAGVADRITFRVAGAADLSDRYDLITFFDCLHDMPDPAGALRAARAATADRGSVMLVEPMSWDSVEE